MRPVISPDLGHRARSPPPARAGDLCRMDCTPGMSCRPRHSRRLAHHPKGGHHAPRRPHKCPGSERIYHQAGHSWSPDWGAIRTLVTQPQDGHSYAINPGSLWTGAIRTTSFIGALQRGHAWVPSLFAKSDTNAFRHPHGVERRTGLRVAAACPLYSPNFCAMELERNQSRFWFDAHPALPRRS